MMAWMFAETSIAPTAPPKTNRTATSSGRLDAQASTGRVRQSASEAATITRRQPNREVSAPASGMVTMEPPPRQSSKRPSTPSSIPVRVLTNGTSGAQAAVPKPTIRKTSRVEKASRAEVALPLDAMELASRPFLAQMDSSEPDKKGLES